MPFEVPEHQDSLYCSPVNNTGLDPLQGFDFFVWVQDVCTGKVAWFGLFQSLTLSIRDATETYLELGQRIPIHLNGEIQIAWVLEQGMVDMGFIERTFGVSCIRRDMYITRGPRFQISFDAHAAELEQAAEYTADGVLDRTQGDATGTGSGEQGAGYRWGADEYFTWDRGEYASYGDSDKPARPRATGRYDVLRAKVDSLSLGLMPGRRVAAIRWEGVAEGICYQTETVQRFKKERQNKNASAGGFITGSNGEIIGTPRGSAPSQANNGNFVWQ